MQRYALVGASSLALLFSAINCKPNDYSLKNPETSGYSEVGVTNVSYNFIPIQSTLSADEILRRTNRYIGNPSVTPYFTDEREFEGFLVKYTFLDPKIGVGTPWDFSRIKALAEPALCEDPETLDKKVFKGEWGQGNIVQVAEMVCDK